MGPMVPPQMAFQKRWPWRSRWGKALSIRDELWFRRQRRRLASLHVLPAELLSPVRSTPGDEPGSPTPA